MARPCVPCAAAAGLVLLAACGPGDRTAADLPDELPLSTLGEPYVEIGAIDGPEEYVLAAVESVVRLGDGSIGVSDAGSTRIVVYDESGAFVRGWGQQGEGPTEFRSLARLYPFGTDSLLAAERYGGRVAVFDLGGELGRWVDAVELSGDTTFVLDSWLHGRFWIDGALTTDARAATRATLERLPPPRLAPGYRRIRVDSEGGPWVKEPSQDGASTDTWTRLDASGSPVAIVEMPSRFRPTSISGDDLLGVWTGESDVHFVRGYRLRPTEESRPVPGWLRGDESAVTSEAAPEEAELTSLMVGAIKSMATAQEIHYSRNLSYTPSIAALDEFEEPEGVGIDFVAANTRGWSAVFTHPAIDRVCGLAYGFDIPPGWTPGMVVCGPVTGPSPAAAASAGDGSSR